MASTSPLSKEIRLLNRLNDTIYEGSATEEQLSHIEKYLERRVSEAHDMNANELQVISELYALVLGAKGNDEKSNEMLENAMKFAGTADNLHSPILQSYASQPAQNPRPVPHAGATKSSGKTLLGLAGSVIAIVLVFGLFNLIIVGGQKAFSSGDEARFNTLKSEIESEKVTLDAKSTQIDSMGVDLDAMESRLKSYEAAGQRLAYNSIVNPYNNALAAYRAEAEAYNASLPAYNAKVDEANELAKSVGSTWYIVPGGRRGR